MGESESPNDRRERQPYSKVLEPGMRSYVLYHTTDLGWGYVYVVQLEAEDRLPIDPAAPIAPIEWASPPVTALAAIDLHEGGDCGPVLVRGLKIDTPVHCDRAYTLGDAEHHDYEAFLAGKDADSLWVIQDAHDPNDNGFAHTRFAELQIPSGAAATIHCLVPHCADNDAAGHCHSEDQMPNGIDPLGGWTDTGESFTEVNGIVRQHFTKTVTDASYLLYHTTTQGWGYLYIVELSGFAEPPAQVRKTLSWPRSWANFSLLLLFSHRNAWASLHLLGQPNTSLARSSRSATCT
jgi:hypothetical protein